MSAIMISEEQSVDVRIDMRDMKENPSDVRIMMVEENIDTESMAYSTGICCKEFLRTDKSCIKENAKFNDCTCMMCLETMFGASFCTTIVLSLFGGLFYCCKSPRDGNCDCCGMMLPPWKSVFFAASWFFVFLVLCILSMFGIYIGKKYGASCCRKCSPNCARGFEEGVI